MTSTSFCPHTPQLACAPECCLKSYKLHFAASTRTGVSTCSYYRKKYCSYAIRNHRSMPFNESPATQAHSSLSYQCTSVNNHTNTRPMPARFIKTHHKHVILARLMTTPHQNQDRSFLNDLAYHANLSHADSKKRICLRHLRSSHEDSAAHLKFA